MTAFALSAAVRMALTGTMAMTGSISANSTPPPPPAPSPPNLNRLTSTTLFSDIAASTALTGGDFGGNIVIPARGGISAPTTDFIVGVYGPHYNHVDLYAKWAWRNVGGDWIDDNGTWQGTAAPHFTFAANSATSGSATYTGIVATSAAKAAFWRGKWNAFIVKCTGGTRALAALHHPSLAAPVMRVTYTDATTADLACLACVRLNSGSSYANIGAQPAVISDSVALEFAMPTKEVSAATIDLAVSSHDASAATISGYVANPPTASGTEEFGIAEGYDEDIGIAAHPSVLFAQRFTDGTTLADYVIASPVNANTSAFSNWSPVVYGGTDDPTKLPTAIGGAQMAGSNKWVQVNFPDTGGGYSLVDSSYTGEGFVPFGPGRGALRLVLPGDSAADGGVASTGYGGALGADLRYYFDKSISGLIDEVWVRQKIRFGWSPKTAAATKMLRSGAGASASYVIPRGKFGVGPHHATAYGGNTNTGGDNLGHSARLGWVSAPADVGNAGAYPFVHLQDFAPARVNLPFGKDGGLGAVFYANQTYEVELRVKLNTYNAAGAIGSSPSDGVVQVWINGVLDSTHTGIKLRDGAIDYGTTPNGPTDLAPFRELGFTGLWLNYFHGGILPPDTDLVMFIGDIVCATEYIGRAAPALPAWVPAPGEVRAMTVANGYVTGRFRDQAAAYYEGYYTADIVSQYNGASVAQDRNVYGTVLNEGSGHGSSNDNSIIELVPDTSGLSYARMTNPTPIFGSGTDTTTKSNNSVGDSTTALLNDKVAGTYTGDGQPMSRHSYGAQSVLAPHHMGGSTYGAFYRLLWNGATYQYLGAGGESPFKVDLTANTGTMAYRRAGVVRNSGDFGTVPLSYAGAPMWQVHVPAQNRIYIESHGGDLAPHWFDLAIGRYITGTGTALTSRIQGNGSRLLYLPWRDLVLMADRDGSGSLRIRYMDVSTTNPSWNNTAVTLGSTLAIGDDWSEITVDKRRQCLIVGYVTGDTTGVYKIDVPSTLGSTWTVTRQAFGASQSIAWAGGQGYGRLDGLDKLRGTALYMTRASKDASTDALGWETVYAYRPATT